MWFYPEEFISLNLIGEEKPEHWEQGERAQHYWTLTLDGSAPLQPNHLATSAYLDFFIFHPLPDPFPFLGCYSGLNKCCQWADGFHSRMRKSQQNIMQGVPFWPGGDCKPDQNGSFPLETRGNAACCWLETTCDRQPVQLWFLRKVHRRMSWSHQIQIPWNASWDSNTGQRTEMK